MTLSSGGYVGRWVCWFCNRVYPNTMLYCPKCNVARKHSQNLDNSSHPPKRMDDVEK